MSIQNRKTIIGVQMAMAMGVLTTSDVDQTSGEAIALSTEPKPKPKPAPKLTGAPFMCSECGRDIKTENGYWHHMINYHGSNTSDIRGDENV